MKSWEYLDNSIARQVISSAGPSHSGFEMPWGHATISRFDLPYTGEDEQRHGYRLVFSHEVGADKELVTRCVASMLVFAMPPQGLDETVTTLWEVFDYHREEVPAISPPREHTLKGTVVDVTDRSPFVLSE